MLGVDTTTVRLFLHVLAACVWVGGQLTLAGLVAVVRRGGPDLTRSVARRFGVVAWPAYAVLLVTGGWNIAAEHEQLDAPGYRHTFVLKLVLVAVSGLAALLHARARSRSRLAVFGAVSGLAALATLFVGVMLAG